MTIALDHLMDELTDTAARIEKALHLVGLWQAYCAWAADHGATVEVTVYGRGLSASLSLHCDLSTLGAEPAGDPPVIESEAPAPWQAVEDVQFWSGRASEPEADPEPAPAAEAPPEPEPDRSLIGAAPEPGHADEPGRAGDWTRAEDAQLLAERKRGATFAAIGAALGRTPGACRMRFNKITARYADVPAPAPDPVAVAPDPVAVAPDTVAVAPDTVAVAPDPVDAPAETAPDEAPPPAALAAADARVNWRLDQLGYRRGWTAALDLDLAEGLSQGRKLAEIALDIGLDAAECKRRWFDLCPEGGIEAQVQILRVLRHRAAACTRKAA